MGRIKERPKFLHEPSTHELFHCLSCMPEWSRISAEQLPDKPYNSFLKWLLEKNFYKERDERISIKRLSTDYKSDSVKVTKWIRAIYEDIFELNVERPALFQTSGIPVTLYMLDDDNACNISLSLPVVPREYESFQFYFAKGKMGVYHYWVKKVEYEVEDDKTTITIWLNGKQLNKYREFALDKALFQGLLHFMDVYKKYDFEVDDQLKELML